MNTMLPLTWLRETVVESPTAVTVSIAAVLADTLYGSARLWLRRRALQARITAGSQALLATTGPCSDEAALVSYPTATLAAGAGADDDDDGYDDAPVSRSTGAGGVAKSVACRVAKGVSNCESDRPLSSPREFAAARATRLRRPLEEKWMSGLLRERGLYTGIVGDAGTGVSTMLRHVADREQGVTYLSLQSVSTLGDLARTFRLEFGLSASVEWSPLGFLLTRALRAMAGAVGNRGDVESNAADDDDDDSEDAEAWRAIVTAFAEALERLSVARQRCPSNRQARQAPVPVLVCDHVGDLDAEAMTALQKWASQCASRGWLHLAIVTDNPVALFPNATANVFRVVTVPDPPARDVIRYLLQRCPILDEATAREIVVTVTGPSVGGVRVAVSLIDEAVFHPNPARIRLLSNPNPPPASLQKSAPFSSSSSAPTTRNNSTAGADDDGDEAVAMGTPQPSGVAPTSSGSVRSSRQVALEGGTYGGHGELEVDMSSGLAHMDLGALCRNVRRGLLAQGFSVSRPLHLYSMQPTGETELDEVRLAVFALALRLLKLHSDALAALEADALAGTTTTGGGASFDAEIHLLDNPVSLRFRDAMKLVPLRVFMKLPPRRNALPLFTSFDCVRFRAPISEEQFRWVIDEPDSAARAAVRKDFDGLVASVDPEAGGWDPQALAALWESV